MADGKNSARHTVYEMTSYTLCDVVKPDIPLVCLHECMCV